MSTPDNIDPIADATAAKIERDSLAALDAVLASIAAGVRQRTAIDDALDAFAGQYQRTIAEALGQVLEKTVRIKTVRSLMISDVTLSEALYLNARTVAAAAMATINEHIRATRDARALALELYEGYGFRKKEVLDVGADLPRMLDADPTYRAEFERITKRVDRYKTPALRSAYLQALDALDNGAGQAVLEKAMRVALHERNRYFANRIAQTELHRAFSRRRSAELMDDSALEVVQIRMSASHPIVDVCDLHSRANLWGLGAGLYPKASAPRTPYHPFCRCRMIRRYDLRADGAKYDPSASRAWLLEQEEANAARIVGSRAMLERVRAGAMTVGKAINDGVTPAYQMKRIGDTGPAAPKSDATQGDVQSWLHDALSERQGPQRIAPLELHGVSSAVENSLAGFGVQPSGRRYALDHDYAIHIMDRHGGSGEHARGQVPIDVNDFAAVGRLFESASIVQGTPPEARNGSKRFEAQPENDFYRYFLVVEVRRQHIVPCTLYKWKKK